MLPDPLPRVPLRPPDPPPNRFTIWVIIRRPLTRFHDFWGQLTEFALATRPDPEKIAMSKRHVLVLLYLFALAFGTAAEAAVEDIVNYRAYSPGFSSSGQPSAGQLAELEKAGFERIVYVAFSDHRNSLPNEDRLVKDLGMEYVHIPVDWESPTAADFALIAAAIDQPPARRTLLHCQVNFRASAFAFLYRVLYEDVPVVEAKADMNSVWTPDDTWRRLIFDVLEANGASPDCDGCDWSIEDE